MSRRIRRTVLHPSGRIWLAGAWGPDEIAVGRNGEATLAVIGDCSLTPSEVDRRTKAVRTFLDVESMLADATGTFVVLACIRGRCYGRGPLSGADRLFTAIYKGQTLVADRARTLAWLTNARIDPRQVAARLCSPGLPSPLDDDTLWAGIHGVHPGHAVTIDERGNANTAAWWRQPEELPTLEAGAQALRSALERVVSAQVKSGGAIGADLSGGFDSTSLCFLAADAGAKLVTATINWSAPGSEDACYAAIAAKGLPIRDALTFHSTELPAQFSGLDARQDPSDEPSFLLRSRLEQRHISAALLALGATCRLSGHGGDDVVQPPTTAVIAGTLRRHPFSGLRHLSASRSQHRLSTRDTFVAAMNRSSYESWVRSGAATLDGRRRGPARWGRPAALPRWAARNAHAFVGDVLRTIDASEVPDPARHSWLHQIQQSGRVAGQLREICAQAGLPCHTPFLDQAVIQAALATPPQIAHDPRAYKPLLAAAMSDLLPGEIRRRTTKDHCLPEWHSGLRGQQRLLAVWCDESRLADMGLVDRKLLRRAVLNPELLAEPVAAIEKTLAVETWLRDVEEIAEPAYLKEE